MSSASEDLKGTHAATTAREGSQPTSFDGIDGAEDNYHGHLGSTRNDNNDMERMGKTQELRVSICAQQLSPSGLIPHSETSDLSPQLVSL